MVENKKKNILGLDLGTNSIGWAWIQQEAAIENGQRAVNDEYLMAGCPSIRMAGSRIIPMTADVMSDFEKGNAVSQTKERTTYRMMRRMNERAKQRRERLNRVLRILDYLPEHYERDVDRYGKLSEESHTTIAWEPTADGKYRFLFMPAFYEMVEMFKARHTTLERIPLDWTLYYLRSKALRAPLSNYELAWVLHSFNQKRGYSQSREDVKEEDKGKRVEYVRSKVLNVEATGERKKGKDTYLVTLANGIHYTTGAADCKFWLGKELEVIVTTKLNSKGFAIKNSMGEDDYSVRMPKPEDWELQKVRTESLIEKSGETVGDYIFNALLSNPDGKIKGAFVNTIDRHFYRDELQDILTKQAEFHPELKDKHLLNACIEALYVSNEGRRNFLKDWNIPKLIVDDVIFYQRPLKSKKSDIAECPYEHHLYKDENGEMHRVGIKCIPVSHPIFQEFRLWQFLSNLRIYQREVFDNNRFRMNVDVSGIYLTSETVESLYEYLSKRTKVSQKELLGQLKLKEDEYRWNYVEDKSYPCGETRQSILSRLKKCKITEGIINDTRPKGASNFELDIWHVLYSVSDPKELSKALLSFAKRWNFTESQQKAFVEVFGKFPPFKKDYGAFSLKAIKRLLPLMRMGTHWSVNQIDAETLARIEHLMSGEEDDNISSRVRKIIADRGMQQSIEQYQALPVWLACYVVYNRHAEASEMTRWESPADMDSFIKNFKQYSLRNPIVEQVSLETLRVVHDVWQTIADEGGRIDEIHLEMGRDLKNSAEKRAEISKRNIQNEATSFRIKLLLQEFYNSQHDIKGVRPYSPSQQELLRLYEDAVWSRESEKPDEILEIRKKLSSSDSKFSTKDIERYRLWLDQKYLSPYTGRPISLARLFTSDYEIEHVIPRSRYFDDSFQNKVICEAEVNKAKDNRLGMQFINDYGGKVIEGNNGRGFTILKKEAYVNLVNDVFKGGYNARKRSILLADEINEDFSHRQLNDTRYIARYMCGVLSNVVREQYPDGTFEQESTSKNLIVCTGQVTDRVKQDWGLNDVWNHIITPRFERLNKMTASHNYGEWCCVDGKRYFQTRVPIELQMGFSKKRIDHRHHAMDAIAIACVSRNVVNYLSNASANETDRIDLRQKLCRKSTAGQTRRYLRIPWHGFTLEAERALQNIMVSFKQNLRILTKATNSYKCYDVEAGKYVIRHQQSKNHYAIRKPLHKDTVYGEVELYSIKQVSLCKALKMSNYIVDEPLRKYIAEMRVKYGYTDKQLQNHLTKVCAQDARWANYDFKKINVRVSSNDEGQDAMMATRKAIDKTFDEKKIATITDTGIQKILRNHLADCDNDPKRAFSPEGIVAMNDNIVRLNDGKKHLPIYKVRLGEVSNGAFAVGQRGSRSKKFVKTAKNTNLFFAVYADEDGKRSFETIDLRTAIEMQKQTGIVAPQCNEFGDKLLFVLSPNDLVYVMLPDEDKRSLQEGNIDFRRVYKTVSASNKQCCFIPYSVAKPIQGGFEYNVHNKVEMMKSIDLAEVDDDISIKKFCIPLKVDRLGRFRLVKI